MKTSAVAKISGASMRQLQWWDEKGFIRPVMVGHERHYTIEQCTACNAMADMRARRVPLARAVEIIKIISRNPLANWLAASILPGEKVYLAVGLDDLASMFRHIHAPMYVSNIRRCTEEPAPRPQLQHRVRRTVPRPAWQSSAPSVARKIGKQSAAESRMAAAAASFSPAAYTPEEVSEGVAEERSMVARAEAARERLAGYSTGERW